MGIFGEMFPGMFLGIYYYFTYCLVIHFSLFQSTRPCWFFIRELKCLGSVGFLVGSTYVNQIIGIQILQILMEGIKRKMKRKPSMTPVSFLSKCQVGVGQVIFTSSHLFCIFFSLHLICSMNYVSAALVLSISCWKSKDIWKPFFILS